MPQSGDNSRLSPPVGPGSSTHALVILVTPYEAGIVPSTLYMES